MLRSIPFPKIGRRRCYDQLEEWSPQESLAPVEPSCAAKGRLVHIHKKPFAPLLTTLSNLRVPGPSSRQFGVSRRALEYGFVNASRVATVWFGFGYCPCVQRLKRLWFSVRTVDMGKDFSVCGYSPVGVAESCRKLVVCAVKRRSRIEKSDTPPDFCGVFKGSPKQRF